MDNLQQVLISAAIMHLEMAEKTLRQISEMYSDTAEYNAMEYGKAKLQIQTARNTVEEIMERKAGDDV